MKSTISGLLVCLLFASSAHAQTGTSSVSGGRLPAVCNNLDAEGCVLELYRRGAIQQAKRSALEHELEACRDRPALPPVISVEYKTPEWVWWYLGISLAAGTALAITAGVIGANAVESLRVPAIPGR